MKALKLNFAALAFALYFSQSVVFAAEPDTKPASPVVISSNSNEQVIEVREVRRLRRSAGQQSNALATNSVAVRGGGLPSPSLPSGPGTAIGNPDSRSVEPPAPPQPLPPPVTSNEAAFQASASDTATKTRRGNAETRFTAARERMVADQIASPARGIANRQVLEVLRKVPRHNFVPLRAVDQAYEDQPVEIGHNRTIEQPYVVASVIEQLDPKPTDRVLELGPGSGYTTAVLSYLVKDVFALESNELLAKRADVDLKRQGYVDNVFIRHGDLSEGWPDAGPFDAIVVTSGPDKIPPAVLAQLKEGGRVVIPIAHDGKMHHLKKSGGRLMDFHSRSARPAPLAQTK